MDTATQDLTLNCILLAENNQKDMKKTSCYIILTISHGSKFVKHMSYIDAKGTAEFNLKDVNVKTADLRFQVFNRRSLFLDKHVGNLKVRVSDLVLAGGNSPYSGTTTRELGKASGKSKKGGLKLSYKLSNNGKVSPAVTPSHWKPQQVESRCSSVAKGDDISLFKTVASFRTPYHSLNWS